ncbi:hypothetical protein HY628_02270, partial [Candidatus Uhrbacteria bacterium]|nr:hypothetical protein [Candidatus Uhrbacteria bacterium]
QELVSHLSPGERAVVEGVQMKLSKVFFDSKIRILYVAKKEAVSKPRTISALKGTFGQFTILDQNGFRIYGNVTTKADYPWQINKRFEYLSLFMIRTLETRQKSILRAYRNRSMGIGAPPFALNIEELATIFHFPIITVKAPLLKKTEAKRGEPPFTLPVTGMQREITARPPLPERSPSRRAAPLAGLPPVESKPSAPASRPAPKPLESAPEAPSNLPFV